MKTGVFSSVTHSSMVMNPTLPKSKLHDFILDRLSLCAMRFILRSGCVSAEQISSADSFSDYNGRKLVLYSLALLCISFARMNSWFESETSRLKGLVQRYFISFSELPFHIEMSGTKDGSAALAP